MMEGNGESEADEESEQQRTPHAYQPELERRHGKEVEDIQPENAAACTQEIDDQVIFDPERSQSVSSSHEDNVSDAEYSDSANSSSSIESSNDVSSSQYTTVRRERSKKKRRKKKNQSYSQNTNQTELNTSSSITSPTRRKRRRKFHLAPKGILDRLLFLWGFRLLSLVLNSEDVLDIPLHLKSPESSRTAGDALEYQWHEELKHANRMSR
jgi:hypothetical protein